MTWDELQKLDPISRIKAINKNPELNKLNPNSLLNNTGGLAVNSITPSAVSPQASITTPLPFDPYAAAAKDGEALFKSMGDEILSGEAGGSFGTGVTVPDVTNGLAGSLSGMWDSIGGAKGFADLAGGIGALGSLYTGYKQNKMAEQEHDARMSELKRQRQRDADWQRDIKASGLGSYSAGMGGK